MRSATSKLQSLLPADNLFIVGIIEPRTPEIPTPSVPRHQVVPPSQPPQPEGTAAHVNTPGPGHPSSPIKLMPPHGPGIPRCKPPSPYDRRITQRSPAFSFVFIHLV